MSAGSITEYYWVCYGQDTKHGCWDMDYEGFCTGKGKPTTKEKARSGAKQHARAHVRKFPFPPSLFIETAIRGKRVERIED